MQRLPVLLLTMTAAAMVAPASTIVSYNVSLTTTPLIGSAAGPFSIEFEFDDGSGTSDGNNTAFLSNFFFSGGDATGVPVQSGGSSGDLTSGITMMDSGVYNDFRQSFSPGSTLQFQVSLTTTVDAGAPPDQLMFALVDNTGSRIPTQGPNNIFLEFILDGSPPSIVSYASDSSTPPVGGGDPIAIDAPQVSTAPSVPEPDTFALMASALCAGCLAGSRVRNRTAH